MCHARWLAIGLLIGCGGGSPGIDASTDRSIVEVSVAADVAEAAPARAALAIDKEEGTFGLTEIGCRASAKLVQFTVTNVGGAATGTLAATTAMPFQLQRDDCSNRELLAGARCPVEVAFAPGAVGTFTGSLAVTGMPGGTVSARLVGSGAQGDRFTVIDPRSYDFGAVAVGMKSPEVTFKFRSVDSTAQDVRVELSGSRGFFIASDGCTNRVLDTCEVTVFFQPAEIGAVSGVLTIGGQSSPDRCRLVSGIATLVGMGK
jgi:hypothetical protein